MSLAAEQPLPAGGCLSPTPPPSAATWASVQCGRVQLVALSASWHDTEMTPSAEPPPSGFCAPSRTGPGPRIQYSPTRQRTREHSRPFLPGWAAHFKGWWQLNATWVPAGSCPRPAIESSRELGLWPSVTSVTQHKTAHWHRCHSPALAPASQAMLPGTADQHPWAKNRSHGWAVGPRHAPPDLDPSSASLSGASLSDRSPSPRSVLAFNRTVCIPTGTPLPRGKHHWGQLGEGPAAAGPRACGAHTTEAWRVLPPQHLDSDTWTHSSCSADLSSFDSR